MVLVFQAPLHHLSHHTRDCRVSCMVVLAFSKTLIEEWKLWFFLFQRREWQSSPPWPVYPMTQCHLEQSSLASMPCQTWDTWDWLRVKCHQPNGRECTKLSFTFTIFLFPGGKNFKKVYWFKSCFLNWQTVLEQQENYLKNCNVIYTKSSIWKLEKNILLCDTWLFFTSLSN